MTMRAAASSRVAAIDDFADAAAFALAGNDTAISLSLYLPR